MYEWQQLTGVFTGSDQLFQHKNATHKKAAFTEEKLHCVLTFTEKVSLNQNFVTLEQ